MNTLSGLPGLLMSLALLKPVRVVLSVQKFARLILLLKAQADSQK